MLDHGVEDDEQLAHAGCEGQLLRLASGQQPLVEVPDNGIEAGGCQGSHIEGGADPGASAPYGTFTPRGFYGNTLPLQRQLGAFQRPGSVVAVLPQGGRQPATRVDERLKFVERPLCREPNGAGFDDGVLSIGQASRLEIYGDPFTAATGGGCDGGVSWDVHACGQT